MFFSLSSCYFGSMMVAPSPLESSHLRLLMRISPWKQLYLLQSPRLMALLPFFCLTFYGLSRATDPKRKKTHPPTPFLRMLPLRAPGGLSGGPDIELWRGPLGDPSCRPSFPHEDWLWGGGGVALLFIFFNQLSLRFFPRVLPPFIRDVRRRGRRPRDRKKSSLTPPPCYISPPPFFLSFSLQSFL